MGKERGGWCYNIGIFLGLDWIGLDSLRMRWRSIAYSRVRFRALLCYGGADIPVVLLTLGLLGTMYVSFQFVVREVLGRFKARQYHLMYTLLYSTRRTAFLLCIAM